MQEPKPKETEAAAGSKSAANLLDDLVRTSSKYSEKQRRLLLGLAGLWLLVVLVVSSFFYYSTSKVDEAQRSITELETQLKVLSGKTDVALKTAQVKLREIEETQEDADQRLAELKVDLANFKATASKTIEDSKKLEEEARNLVSTMSESQKRVNLELAVINSEIATALSASKAADLAAARASAKSGAQEVRSAGLEGRLKLELERLDASVFRAGSYLLVTSHENPLITLGLEITVASVVVKENERSLRELRIRSLEDSKCQLWPIDPAAAPCRSKSSRTVQLGDHVFFDDAAGKCRFSLTPTFIHKHKLASDLIGIDVSWTDGAGKGSCDLVTFGEQKNGSSEPR